MAILRKRRPRTLFVGLILICALFCPLIADSPGTGDQQMIIISYSLVPSLLMQNIVMPSTIDPGSPDTGSLQLMPSIINVYRVSGRD